MDYFFILKQTIIRKSYIYIQMKNFNIHTLCSTPNQNWYGDCIALEEDTKG